MKTRFHHIHIDQPHANGDTWDKIFNLWYKAEKWGCVKRHYNHKFPNIRGVTTCEIQKDDETLSVGYAFCSSADQFSRKKGRAIAEGRAWSNLIMEEGGQ